MKKLIIVQVGVTFADMKTIWKENFKRALNKGVCYQGDSFEEVISYGYVGSGDHYYIDNC